MLPAKCVHLPDEEIDLGQDIDLGYIEGLLERRLRGGVVEEWTVVQEPSEELYAQLSYFSLKQSSLTPCSYALKVSKLFALVFWE